MTELVVFKDSKFRVSVLNYSLRFKFPFKLALNTRTHTDLVFLNVETPEISAFGEASLPPYLGETVESAQQFLKSLNWVEILYSPVEDAMQRLDELSSKNNAAKAAVDMALHDYHSKKNGKSLANFLEIPVRESVFSTYTIGISDRVELLLKLEEGRDFKTIKLKLGSSDDKAILKTFKKNSNKPFCVDINAGYTSRDEAAQMAEFLMKQGAIFIEQPLPAPWLEEMAWIKDRVEAVFIADESVRRLPDLKYIEEAFHGVNVKLMKSTGINEALKMIAKLREKELKIVLGAMAESSLGNTAAAHLSPLADWVDLDGPMLSVNDPFKGILYRDGKIRMPTGPGIGAKLNGHYIN